MFTNFILVGLPVTQATTHPFENYIGATSNLITYWITVRSNYQKAYVTNNFQCNCTRNQMKKTSNVVIFFTFSCWLISCLVVKLGRYLVVLTQTGSCHLHRSYSEAMNQNLFKQNIYLYPHFLFKFLDIGWGHESLISFARMTTPQHGGSIASKEAVAVPDTMGPVSALRGVESMPFVAVGASSQTAPRSAIIRWLGSDQFPETIVV